MAKTYYIIDEDGDVYMTHDRAAAIEAAQENDMATVISPSDEEWWVGTDRHQIGLYIPPADLDDEDENEPEEGEEDSDD